MTMHFLVLYPENPAWGMADIQPLEDALRTIGFLGTELGPGLHASGAEYLNLVTYLGCSPQVSLGEHADATRIRLHNFLKPRCLHGANIKTPRCPRCKIPLTSINPPVDAEQMVHCGHCGHDARMNELDWRRSLAFSKVYIEITNVFESEAVPAEKLADCLNQATGEIWDYCYVREER